MDFLEKDLEDILFEAMESIDGKNKLYSLGLPSNGKPFRQVKLGNYGRIDILTVSICKDVLVFNVYELKKGKINLNALIQGCRYIEGLRQLLEKYNKRFRIVYVLRLIGREIEENDFVFLYNNLPKNIEFYTYSYHLDGIKFEYITKRWHKTGSSFSEELIETISTPGVELLRSVIKSTIQDNE